MGTNRKNVNSLKYLMNEVISEKRLTQNINSNTIKFTTLDESTINSMLESNLFTQNESNAIRILFSKTKTKTLSESVIKKLDKSVKTIVESVDGDAILSEGFFGDIWDGLKGLGDKAKEVLAGGWDKVKAVWGEFKELVTEVASACKEGLQKAFASALAKGKELSAKVGEEAKKKFNEIKDAPSFLKEVGQLAESGTYLTTTFYNKWIANPTWEADMIDGKVAPSGDVKVDPAKAEDGLEDLKTMESVNKSKLNLIKERNELLSNKKVIEALYRSSNARAFLMEGGGFAHLEGAIKNPFLKGVVEWALKILQAVFIPLAKIGQMVANVVGKEILKKFSEGVKFLGGPGVFPFVIISGILSELLEIYLKGQMKKGPEIIAMMAIPVLAPLIATLSTFQTTVEGFLFWYTVGTIIINIIPILKQGGGEKHESYSPTGKFKIKEGNLLYIK
jgi:hypothetical protein